MSDDPPYDIEICNEQNFDCVDEDLLRRILGAALRRFEIRRAHLSVAVVSDPRIAAVHQQFCGISGPTDVLTFDLADRPRGGPDVDGEIVVSADTAARVAGLRGHSAQAELALYVVHGALHLLGLDDHDPQQALAMHAVEDDILEHCGLDRIFGGT